jgi:hypothetical protein
MKFYRLSLIIFLVLLLGGSAARAQVAPTQLEELQRRLAELLGQLNSWQPNLGPAPLTGAPPTPVYSTLHSLLQRSAVSGGGATGGVVSPPVINSLSPASGPRGTRVTINGANFSTTADNTIYTGYGEIAQKSSDGRTLVITFEPPKLPGNLGNFTTADFPPLDFYFYVRTPAGLSEFPARFNLTL